MVSKEMYELGAKRSVIRELFEYGKQQAAIVGKENVFDFSIGNPTVPAPECVKEAMIELLETKKSDEIHGYTSAQGDIEVRKGLAEYMNSTYKSELKADNFYMTCGAAASLCITLKALTVNSEDEFIIVAPYFPEYQIFIKSAGGKVVIIPADTEDFQINMDLLEKAITPQTKGIIINSPNNPSGVVYSEKTFKNLADLLKNKSKEYEKTLYLISDEPYREIVYDDIQIPYVPSYYENTIVCYSYSKSISLPGERIGYILVPDCVENSKEIYTAVCGAGRSFGYVCAPSLFQKVVLKCLGKTSDIGLYDANRKLLYDGLSKMGYQCVRPDGAFYLFVKALEEDAVNFSENAKKFNLLIVPGDDFGCPGYVRISYCVDPEMLKRSFDAFQKLRDLYK
ncbi:pyridoxal phosphate-dependent aminotransferase [Clostridium thailandense]|uniref:Pyridoxal phosphate-dependent aminotransferase n=1 Tax=Clostridium thailandense TaxID=2794346 RepID=A0A949U117_9CLOT|nr:pyridoxal phosphate-dependent aminotransferase [Clostridium thailandense]MBV7275395.1 pyridoxal phosphate-dependent aminotransferase [Clostridium thailandense]MCH5136109.1 pyridoxal phosphate-dependent aminotransferase [Clostridiaceae bacterium UIB06]